MRERTNEEMQARLSTLRALLREHNLTLRLAGELDAIQNHGLRGWNDYLRRRG